MQYGRLGTSNLRVSRICLGTNNFGSQLGEDEAAKIIGTAIEVGITFIDTANVYVEGRSEEIIGRALKGDRNRMVVATKVGIAMPGDTERTNLARDNILTKADDSLRRLQTDHIDLYYLHRFDPKVPLKESLGAMDLLVREGKVDHVGISNFSADQLNEAFRVCEDNDFVRPVALQPQYNLMSRDAEKDLFPLGVKRNLGVVTYSPLAGGFLTGKYFRGTEPPRGTRAAFNPNYWRTHNSEENFARLESLSNIAKEATIPLTALAIRWILSKPAVTSAVVGASRPEQVEENCRILGINVPANMLARLDSA